MSALSRSSQCTSSFDMPGRSARTWSLPCSSYISICGDQRPRSSSRPRPKFWKRRSMSRNMPNGSNKRLLSAPLCPRVASPPDERDGVSLCVVIGCARSVRFSSRISAITFPPFTKWICKSNASRVGCIQVGCESQRFDVRREDLVEQRSRTPFAQPLLDLRTAHAQLVEDAAGHERGAVVAHAAVRQHAMPAADQMRAEHGDPFQPRQVRQLLIEDRKIDVKEGAGGRGEAGSEA